jgi:ArsR family transcriptional regulator
MTTATARPLLPLVDSDAGPCCPPLASAPLSEADAEVLAERLKALADPARLRLMSLVLASDAGEGCICELTDPLGLSQPTVSHHMKVLVGAGLLEREKRGRWAYFRAVPGAMDALAAVLITGSR